MIREQVAALMLGAGFALLIVAAQEIMEGEFSGAILLFVMAGIPLSYYGAKGLFYE